MLKLLSSQGIIILFIVECIAGAIFAGFEKNWGRLVYFVGGAILNIGLLLLK
jgi:hypothetical protein